MELIIVIIVKVIIIITVKIQEIKKILIKKRNMEEVIVFIVIIMKIDLIRSEIEQDKDTLTFIRGKKINYIRKVIMNDDSNNALKGKNEQRSEFIPNNDFVYKSKIKAGGRGGGEEGKEKRKAPKEGKKRKDTINTNLLPILYEHKIVF